MSLVLRFVGLALLALGGVLWCGCIALEWAASRCERGAQLLDDDRLGVK